ncbi:toxin-antitoxin system HicB family antitoxin [Morganella morganii]|uniref:toxin-antitoxin system HicB family antitoxin n=1 Tax=Morganella morganii TaxID=582 RepID=UPI000BFE0654|nr:toxin-antitoxin system HicB family antitoxin [Morganella morganii]EKU4288321.1 toxin-antitoxin system HicB family antitoxin [Morganella morganii]EKU4302426.1 toxin-antitoxin system HicB family antitoxin [Morganella morganii]EKU5662272.1 toxin-antitoxin system HicB family antitoxin [Morganella morganii]EKU5690168.1 toxin-antitoxin system HicB family antitoxin [Morganella morganii]EKY1475492.1 toxin-antitoxin system HicB family antitoxin [Morganella morganii]
MTNKVFDPEKYTISVKKTTEDGEVVFVASVAELPDIREYADTADFARELAIDSISTAYEVFAEQGMIFPQPSDDSQIESVSGRVTLRLPKSIHAKCIKAAENDGVSLNSYLTTCITSYSAQNEIKGEIRSQFTQVKALIKSHGRSDTYSGRMVDRGGNSWVSSLDAKFSKESDTLERDSEIQLSGFYSELYQ